MASNTFLSIWTNATTLSQLIFVVLLLYFVGTGVIKLPKSQKKLDENEALGIHVKCANFPSLKLLVMDAIQKSAEIQRILINDTLNEQMNEADDLFIDMRSQMKKTYLKLYKEKTSGIKSNILRNKEVNCYLSLLDNMESPLKGMTRRFLKKNHFLERSDMEFREYIKQRTADYQSAVAEFLDDHYDGGESSISTDELHIVNMKEVYPLMEAKVESFFHKVRKIAEDKREEVVKLRGSIREFL